MIVHVSVMTIGALAKAASGRRTSDNAQRNIVKYRAQLEAYEKLCAEVDIPPAQAALAWLLTRPQVTAPIVGPRTQEQLDEAVTVLGRKLDATVLDKLETIFPGPGGAAPEAYAW